MLFLSLRSDKDLNLSHVLHFGRILSSGERKFLLEKVIFWRKEVSSGEKGYFLLSLRGQSFREKEAIKFSEGVSERFNNLNLLISPGKGGNNG